MIELYHPTNRINTTGVTALNVNGNLIISSADVGVANGVAPLNAEGKIDVTYLQENGERFVRALSLWGL